MTKLKAKRFSDILNNKTSGSSELVELLNNYFLITKSSGSELRKKIDLAKSRIGHFQAVSEYLNALSDNLKNEADFNNFLTDHSVLQTTNIELIFNKTYPELEKFKSIITLSRSGNLLAILKLWHQKNRKIRVVICESRPKFEGRLMAKELASSGIETLLITDAMMNLYVSQVDAAIVGADSILKNGNVINKVGSKSLALLCKEYGKPFFVVSTKDKLSNRSGFDQKSENPREVLDSKIKNLSVSNNYFEEVEKKFITKIFTN